jgi:phosphoribosyl 1,2-cyclic phosphate phosphodiesterase
VKKGTLTVLGSATSMGVPTIGCSCAVCRSSDPRDRRTRPSVMIEWEGHRIVIDSGPDFREQALREGIDRLDAVLYTHGHADHILGLDDLRPLTFPRITGGARVPLYATPETARVLRTVFKYVFEDNYKYGHMAKVDMHEITEPFELLGLRVIPVPVMHGDDNQIIGFRIGRFAYLTDFSALPESSIKMLEGIDVVFLDALRHEPHPTHSTVAKSLILASRIGAAQTYFTHICHELAHEETNQTLPPTVRLAYDGLRVEIDLES